MLAYLLDEQYGLCCYSEVRADLLGFGHHIEHVQNKSQHPQLTFAYQNLAASALSSDDLGNLKVQGHEAFGGHAVGKQTSVDPTLFVSCHQSDCARYFAYLSDGRVVPRAGLDAQDAAKARYIIQLLNLDSPYLKAIRQEWWDELDRLFAEHQAKNWSLPHLIALDITPAGGKVSPFFSLTRQFFGNAAEDVLAQQAPQLA